MLEANQLTQINKPAHRWFTLDLDQMNLGPDFRFSRLSHPEFWRNYMRVLAPMDIVEVSGLGSNCQFICVMVDHAGCHMQFHGGHLPDESALENASA